MIPEKNNLIEPIYTASPDDSIDPVVLHHINVKKSPREWLRDPSFAESMLYDPADATITGNGANSYIRAKNRVQNFRLGEPRRSQEEYQRLMHKGKISADEGDRLHYLINVLDEKWQNALRGYKGDGTDPKYKRNYEKYIKQRQILEDNYNNWLQAREVRGRSWGRLRNPLFMVPGAMGEAWSENIGTPIREWWDSVDLSGLQNAILQAQIAEAPAVMTASGWKVENDGTVTFGHENEPGVTALRNNLAVIGGTGLTAMTAPVWAPHAPGMAASYFGGEALNEAAKLAGYKDFGDAVVTGTGLGSLVEGTGWEQPVRDVANFLNPGYFLPSGKVVNTVGSLIDDGVRTAKTVASDAAAKTVDNLKTIRVQSPVYVTEEVVAPATSAGGIQTPERFVSRSWGWRSPLYRKPTPNPTPTPTPTPTPSQVPGTGSVPPAGTNIGTEYTFKKQWREMTKRGVEVDPKYNKALKNFLKNEDPELIDAFAAEARKHYAETGEMVSLTNQDMLYNRATERLREMRRLRNNLYHGDYIDEFGVTQSYSSEQLNNFSRELRNHNIEMSYVDPGAKPLNGFHHPVTNLLSQKPTDWAAKHPYLSALEAGWPLWTLGSSTIWGRDWWSEGFPNFLKFLFVRPEESKPVETTPQQESSAFDKTIDPADTTGVAKRNAIQQRKAQINPK